MDGRIRFFFSALIGQSARFIVHAGGTLVNGPIPHDAVERSVFASCKRNELFFVACKGMFSF